MVRMAASPVGKDQNSRTLFTNQARDFQAIVPGIFHATIRDIQSRAKRSLQDFCCVRCFTRAVIRSAASAHLTLREIKDAGSQPALGHFDEGATTCLLHVIAMGS